MPPTPKEQSVKRGEAVKAEQAFLNRFPYLGKNTRSYEICTIFVSLLTKKYIRVLDFKYKIVKNSY